MKASDHIEKQVIGVCMRACICSVVCYFCLYL